MSVSRRIEEKLIAALAPAGLEVVDQSDQHAGHAGARPEGESHFAVIIVAEAFRGRNRVDRQRLVNAALRDELAGPVHALSIKALTPEEAEATA
ncbi:MAG: BolA family protein [Alphaproteobacteria bacterium]|jgi:BolA protein|nr:BolA family protein [Alphaproteobacteria bacterium]MDP6567082.1 BolA family protein [Alphaproteobacteria bacterium]MDP6811571.1 BolA family protein [Alphaproteobacteria bacterium]|tara:strand:+ start:1246 stop:1527 length:282 start_codon:yes stop_codon:yes gene_type:complete